MMVWLRRGRCQRERDMVATLSEQGHDVIAIAAAALKLVRAEEQQRPIAPISELREARPRQVKPVERRRNQGKEKAAGRLSHEKGMVRLALKTGRADGLNVSHIVGSLSHHADIPGRCIGKISIQNQTTFVDVPEEVVSLLLAKKDSYRIGRRRIDIQRA
jgi:ATP-dependent RNA helicase DeaD